ncbi:MAG TPA: Hsp33 family molecular chaperone HslO [Anaeromyxobacteraceae bacterium]|nr:Hsp33 family molecular chaperone HslO [Anaeromyxobacteraceae bacterium]
MTDRLVRGLYPDHGLRAVFVRVADTARMARVLHGLYPTSARLFAEALAAGLLVGSLQKDRARVNLQIECDGPIRGLLVDADAEGSVRGTVRRPEVNFPGDPELGARAALGGSGFLSVLRDLGAGNWYRAHVELRELSIPKDLARYFAESEQTDTALDVAVLASPDEPLTDVAGVLVQKLPDGDPAAVEQVRRALSSGALGRALDAGGSPQDVLAAIVGPGFELMADLEVAYRCSCSIERARSAVSALGRDELEDVLRNEKQAEITCEFCRQHYVVGEEELRTIARRLAEQE